MILTILLALQKGANAVVISGSPDDGAVEIQNRINGLLGGHIPTVNTTPPPFLPTELPPSLATEISLSTELPPSLATELPPSLPTELPPSVATELPPSLPTELPPSLPTELPPPVATELHLSLPTELPPPVATELYLSLPTELPPSVATELPPSVATELPPSVAIGLPPFVAATEITTTLVDDNRDNGISDLAALLELSRNIHNKSHESDLGIGTDQEVPWDEVGRLMENYFDHWVSVLFEEGGKVGPGEKRMSYDVGCPKKGDKKKVGSSGVDHKLYTNEYEVKYEENPLREYLRHMGAMDDDDDDDYILHLVDYIFLEYSIAIEEANERIRSDMQQLLTGGSEGSLRGTKTVRKHPWVRNYRTQADIGEVIRVYLMTVGW